MKLAALFTAAVALVPQAMAHYNFERLIVNGVITQPYEYVRRMNNSNGPIQNYASNDLRCNQGTLATAKDTKTYRVQAGTTVGFTIRDVLGHPGPLFAYMSRSTVANVSNYDGSGDWFKIYSLGVKDFATYTTGMTWLSDGFTSYTFKLPTKIPNGQYLLRAEHIATHSAGSAEGPQHYISCAQIEVYGAAGGTPSPTGKLPGMYKFTDPGLNFNPWWPPVTNYTMPGPAVYNG